ncbi:HesA/MoeB/ThiF family protein [Streptococcus sp. 121]|uniref:HesA/MoeB/ThiF family protein n=1 Tax=Streptococcus sp. 121 TaxID=2797637 RepID=UPI001F2190BD|nr:ThiF family adenylyltransferase [Streptococcus sp. 121]
MKISILGCGGGGSHIAYQLAQLGVGEIHLVDDDIVEEGNINRQSIFNMNDIGKHKVQCVSQFISKRQPSCGITTSSKRLCTVNTVQNEIDGSDWVICCIDEPPYIAQRLVNRASHLLEIPSVYCFSQRSAGKVLFCDPSSEDTGCIDCLLVDQDCEHFQKLVGRFTNNEYNLITANILPNILMLTSWVVKHWLDYISGRNRSVTNKLLRFNFDRFVEEEFQIFKKEEDCPTCGSKENRSKLWEIIKIE